MAKLKTKKCKVCPERFVVHNSLVKVCSPQCALVLVRAEQEKKSDKEHNQRKRELKDNDKGFQTGKAQKIFNRFIRLRDVGNTCISCGGIPRKKNAGHFKSRGAHPELRFEESNCHLQCEHCNTFLSGNLVKYREGLAKKIGVEKLEWLEGPHKEKKYTIDDLKHLQRYYTDKIRELES